MGKTLMDGKSKEQKSSQSEDLDSFRNPFSASMRLKQTKYNNFQLQTFSNKYESSETVSLDAEDDNTSQLSGSQQDNTIIPSAPVHHFIPDHIKNTPQIENNNSFNINRNLKGSSELYKTTLNKIDESERICLMTKEEKQPNSPDSEASKISQTKMNSFETDEAGFIGGLQVSQDTDWLTSVLIMLSMIIVVLTFPISMFFCFKIVAEYERAVVLRMGRLLPNGKGTKGPGLFFVLPCIDSMRTVELRTVTFSIPPQEVLTRDSVTVAVDAVVYYRICNPAVSILNVEDAARSTRLLAQTTLRNVLGTKDLAQILMDREEMSATMQSSLDAATEAWGVKVERVEIKDVRLPVALQRAMAAEAEATREARAKVIAATGEHRASGALKEAARVIGSSPMALQLRYLQTLSTISAEKNSTIIFPLPIDILNSGSRFSALLGNQSDDFKLSQAKNRLVKNWLPNILDSSVENLSPVKDVGETASHNKNSKRSQLLFIGPKTEQTQAHKVFPHCRDEDFDTYSDSV